MAYTKMYEKNGHWVLLVRDSFGKYKQLYKHKLKSVVQRQRHKYQDKSIDTEAAIAKKTFVETYAEFAAYKLSEANDSKHGVKYQSVICYTRWLNKYIKPYFPTYVLLTDISPHLHAIPFFKRICQEDVGGTWKAAENVVKSFLTCLNYSIERQYIRHTNGFDKFSCRKSSALKARDQSLMQRKKTPMITYEEAFKLFKHLMPKEEDIKHLQRFAVVSTFIFTGMRMSELRGLRWDHINLDAEVPKYTIAKTIVGTEMYDAVKAEGSNRTNLMPTTLAQILKVWKKQLSLHFTPRKVPFVFPSLRNTGAIIPLCERTINDWLKLAYHDLGFAVVETVKNKSGNSKHYVRTVSSKFGNSPSKTFRHFASTSLLDNQHRIPELTDNFIKGYIGHKDIKTTKMIYGNHTDLNSGSSQDKKIQKALDKAIPISLESDYGY